MNVKIIADKAEFNKLLDTIKAAGAKLELQVHQAACTALFHAGEHGDVTGMQRLIDVLPGFARRNALIAWAIAHGKFKASEDGKSVDFNKHGTTLLEAGEAKPFWEFKPEAAFKPFDLAAELARLVKQAEKAAKDERNSLDTDDLLALRKLAGEAKPAAVVASTKAIDNLPANDADSALAGVA